MNDAEYYKIAESYSVNELREALAGIDKERYPSRYKFLISQYEMKTRDNCASETLNPEFISAYLARKVKFVMNCWFQVVFSIIYTMCIFFAIGAAHTCKCEQHGNHQALKWIFDVCWVLISPMIWVGFYYMRASGRTLWSAAMLAYSVLASLTWGVTKILIIGGYLEKGLLNTVMWIIVMGSVAVHFVAFFNKAKSGLEI